jgi:hypothetical protein
MTSRLKPRRRPSPPFHPSHETPESRRSADTTRRAEVRRRRERRPGFAPPKISPALTGRHNSGFWICVGDAADLFRPCRAGFVFGR